MGRWGVWGIVLLLGMMAGGPLRAGEPPSAPILRIETGMHTAPIWQVSVDAAETMLLTVSEDKTARLWSLPEGKLLRILRPPIGDGYDGKLYAGVLSPDGTLAAVGGLTGYGWDTSHSVYVFDTGSGALVQRLGGLPNVVLSLAFSGDGKRLAAGLGGANGIGVWETETWAMVGEDGDYGGGVYGLSFAADGRLAVTSYDGSIRLYDADLTLQEKVSGPSGGRPNRLAFSPDGRHLAVGYYDRKRVEVRDGTDLRLLWQPDVSGGTDSNLASVAWAREGDALFAAGQGGQNGKLSLRRWSDGGRGSFKDFGLSEDTVFSLIPCGEGGVCFGAADPFWGVVDGSGNILLSKAGDRADVRAKRGAAFTVDAEGKRVRFGLASGEKEPYLFDLLSQTFEASAYAPSGMLAPKTDGVSVAGWKNTTDPTLNGTSLPLKPYERSRSVAVAPRNDRFALGTEYWLRLFDPSGDQIWKKPAPGITWGVNIPRDAPLVVAAYGDGTIRWHRLSDGQELLALFVHAGDKRWVAWTPGGYYMASPGAESLIGWHVNRGREREADFYGAGRFRETFNRPDVVMRVLDTLDEAQALRLANDVAERAPASAPAVLDSLPPVVDILDPLPGARFADTKVRIRFRVRSPSGLPVTRVRLLIDGQAPQIIIKTPGRLDDDGEVFREIITLPAKDVVVGIVADTEDRAGEVSSLPMTWVGRTPAPDPLKPVLYALLVGTSAYSHPDIPTLKWAARDAEDLAAALVRQKGGLYRDVQVRLVTDGDKDDLLDGLDWLEKSVTSRDVGLFFISGHGISDSYEDYWYLPRDGDMGALRRTAVRSAEFDDVMGRVSGKAVMLVDTCHGALARSRGIKGMPATAQINSFVNEMAAADNGVVVFTSSTGTQVSRERDDWANGAFTEALLEALAETRPGMALRADLDGNGVLTIAELDHYIAERVKALTGGTQTPVMIKSDPIPDIPLLMVR